MVDSRTAYLRELKRATESLHHSGWLEGEARRLGDVIASDARRDAAKWGLGDLDEGVNALVRADPRQEVHPRVKLRSMVAGPVRDAW